MRKQNSIEQSLQPQESLQGSVDKILWRDNNSGFGIFVLRELLGQSSVVTGTFPLLALGQEVSVSGVWTVHPRFGRRFEAQSYYTTTPTSIAGLKAYLGSGFIKGIGENFADKLVDLFGTDVLRVIDLESHKLKRIPGLGEKRIEAICSAWREHKELAQIMMFLQEKGLSAAYATRLYKFYKEQTVSVLQENPYRLIDDIWGIGFTTADSIAQKMGLASTAPHRLAAGVVWCLKHALQQGHLYVSRDKLFSYTQDLLQLPVEVSGQLITNAVEGLRRRGSIVLVQHGLLQLYALPASYATECAIADRIQLLQATQPTKDVTLQTIAYCLESDKSFACLTQEQRNALLIALTSKVTIITGGPGTGKTTLIKALITCAEQQRMRYKLTAPTGRAAKRMSETTGKMAMTLHRLLEFDSMLMSFRHNEQHPLTTDLIIVDEVSMIDTTIARALLGATPLHAHIVLIGDIDQLPPVGAGNFLRDCIASAVIPTIRLTHIFRQAEHSLITMNAHRIREGAFPLATAPDTRSDFLLIIESDPEAFATHLKRVIYSETVQRGLDPASATVLCPMHRGAVGTQAINQSLQALFNPRAPVSFVYAGTTFKLNDRVMQLRNNYEKAVFNGDMGTIISIDLEEKTCEVTFDGRAVLYQFDEASELMLAYATTIHKSQGSQFPVVIIPVFMQHFMMLRRNLLYTGITRAQHLCIVIGEKRAIACALRQIENSARITLLAALLSEGQQSICIVPVTL